MPSAPNQLSRWKEGKIWDIFKVLLLINISFLPLLEISNALVEYGHECSEDSYIKCKNQRCVAKNFVCDGENDCGDNSDEQNCSTFINHKSGGGYADGPDRGGYADGPSGCDEDSFLCLDGLCILNHWVCDGKDDCADRSDETYGCNNTVPCDDGFRCTNRFCIPKSFHCDGDDDCGDNSDEALCPMFEPANCNINNKKFLCNDKIKCLKLKNVCDGVSHCLDGSDEGGLCLGSGKCQPECTNGHKCTLTPSKALCICPEGFSDQQGYCKDVNECQEFGVCDQKCINTVGSYSCSCIDHFELQPDGKSCKASGGEGLLLFSSEHEIRAYYLESQVYYPISDNISHASGIAYDGNQVYWSNVAFGKESIVRSSEHGGDVAVVVNFGLGTVENIALDWVTDNIYFTDSQKKHIGVCMWTGEHCMILHNDGVDSPRGIAIHPKKGMLYWSDWGESAHSIVKSGMDGSDRTNFVVSDIYWPNGITIDFGTDRLYWADANKKRIESILLDGTDRRIIVSEPVDRPLSIFVYENALYWSDWKGNQILSCNKFTGKNHTVIVKKHDSPIYNLYIFHPSIHDTTVSNPCLRSNCSHLCLLRAGGQETSCGCPNSMSLSNDSRTCVNSPQAQAIYVAAANTVYKINYDHIGRKNFEEHTMDGVSVLGDIAYNAFTDSILISDVYKHRITSLSRASKTHSTVHEAPEEVIIKMEHDPIANNLYWLDGKTNSLKVMDMDSLETIILIPDFGDDIPTDLQLAPEYGILFISLHNSKGGSHIDKFSMDGTSRIHFVERDLIGPIITLKYDGQLHRLFIADQGAGQIFSTGVDNLDKHIVRDNLPGPIGLTIHGLYIFWVNYGSNKVFWTNKFDSQNTMMTVIDRKVDVLKLISLESYDVINNTTCHENNGGCSHLCLLKLKSQVCACPSGMTLDQSGRQCISRVRCSEDQMTCSTGECIKKSMICNGIQDCPTAEDEANCKATTLAPPKPTKPACPLDYFFCLDGNGCVPMDRQCDSFADCSDASDEHHCSSHKTCSSAHFTCKSGDCIPSTWRCDDRFDCLDNSDEENCKSNLCDSSKDFKCNSGHCIPKTWECDSELDCPDSSDEHSRCDKTNRCAKGMFTCLNHKCVDEKLECNGFDDCGDNSDEVQCLKEVDTQIDESAQSYLSIHLCNVTHFTCSGLKGLCIPLEARCNSTFECTYGEDEKDCSECTYGFFECQLTKECVPEVWVCDGMPDCKDKTDEAHDICLTRDNDQENFQEKAKNDTVTCDGVVCKDSQTCVPNFKVCDGNPDCGDGSDERGLCGMGCPEAGCQQVCRSRPDGAQCDCGPGYRLASDGRSCLDVDECAGRAPCSQRCRNTVGSYVCSCLTPYYQLRDDRVRCKATGKEMEMVYITEKDIRITTESLSSVRILHEFKSPSLVDSIDVNVEKGLLYWTSKSDDKVRKLELGDGSKVEELGGLDGAGPIAVDWISSNIYIVLSNVFIRICRSDKFICSQIYKGPQDCKISAVAVDAVDGVLFWSEVYESLGHSMAKLMKSDLTGRHSEVLLESQSGIQSVSDISVDHISKWLYCGDPVAKTITRLSYNASKLQVVTATPDGMRSIGLFEDHVYIVPKFSKQSLTSKLAKYGVVQKCVVQSEEFKDCQYLRLLPSSSKAEVKKLRIAHRSLQIEGVNYCGKSNCTGVCVNSNKKAICLCEMGILAPPDGSCPNMIQPVENIKVEAEHSSGYMGFIVCILLVSLTVMALAAAIKLKKLSVPDNIYGRATSKIKQLKSMKLRKFNDSSFQFDNFKNELVEELIPENEEFGSNLRNF